MLNGFLCFLGMMGLDIAYARYTIAISNGQALISAVWSAILIAISIFVTTEFVKDISVAPWVIAGAFVGTYIAVRWE